MMKLGAPGMLKVKGNAAITPLAGMDMMGCETAASPVRFNGGIPGAPPMKGATGRIGVVVGKAASPRAGTGTDVAGSSGKEDAAGGAEATTGAGDCWGVLIGDRWWERRGKKREERGETPSRTGRPTVF